MEWTELERSGKDRNGLEWTVMDCNGPESIGWDMTGRDWNGFFTLTLGVIYV